MILMGIVSMGLMFGMPYLMENSKPYLTDPFLCQCSIITESNDCLFISGS